LKVLNVVVTEAVTYQRRCRVPDVFDTEDLGAVESLFVNDECLIDGVIGVVCRDVKPVDVSSTVRTGVVARGGVQAWRAASWASWTREVRPSLV
jgi:hypothetical protein